MDRNLALEVVRVTRRGARVRAPMGRGDASAVDRCGERRDAACSTPWTSIATVVVGEGREGEVEGLRRRAHPGAGGAPIDVALDALEGATVCATGGTNALSIIPISERGRILSCPETYMDKLAVGPEGKGVVSLEKTPQENLRALADAKGVYVEDLTVVVLDRPRHDGLIDQVRKAGARVQILADGDLAAGIAASRPAAASTSCSASAVRNRACSRRERSPALGGEFQGRFRPRNDDERNRLREAGIGDLSRIYGPADLVGDKRHVRRRDRRHQRASAVRRALLPRRRHDQLGGDALAHAHRALDRGTTSFDFKARILKTYLTRDARRAPPSWEHTDDGLCFVEARRRDRRADDRARGQAERARPRRLRCSSCAPRSASCSAARARRAARERGRPRVRLGRRHRRDVGVSVEGARVLAAQPRDLRRARALPVSCWRPIRGAALGSGCELLLSCDLAIAGEALPDSRGTSD